MNDETLEEEIKETRKEMLKAPSRERKIELAKQMGFLISQRSPERVEMMERGMGIRG